METIKFTFNINGTCYIYTDSDKKDRVLYQNNIGMFYKKNGNVNYLSENDVVRFNKTQGYK